VERRQEGKEQMIPSQLLPLANHLWQTTLFADAAGLLTLLLQKNRAFVRYWLWIAASLKFLIPFSVLMEVGGLLRRHTAAGVPSTPVATGLSFAFEQVSEPFTSTAREVAIPGAHWPYTGVIVPVLIALWAVGFAWLVCRWAVHWRRIRASVRTASSLNLPIGWPVKSPPAFGEPGVFGVVRPVLLLPDGILDRLAPPEMDAIVAHELCHIRRRDNLVTVIHMAVESLFWFHPLVWWVGARLIEEREGACDEDVLQTGGDPQAYAEGILKICELYIWHRRSAALPE
jgi:bla regulator protein blaR1